jgi:hypothetical protein
VVERLTQLHHQHDQHPPRPDTARTSEHAPASAPAPIDLLIVIVNYRTPDLTIACLHSLASEITTVPHAHVALVDNASNDDSLPRLRHAIATNNYAPWITLLEQPQNLGFAGGNNRAIQAFPHARYTLLLNSDTVVHPGCLRYCFDLMQRETTIGAMSCKLLNPDQTPQAVARKFPTPLRQLLCAPGLPWRFPRLFAWADPQDDHWDRNITKRDVDWLGGAFLFIRGDLLRNIGPLDEDFFFYGEDIEFSHRIKRAGFRRHYDPAVSITHYGGGSSDPQRLARARRNASFWRAHYLVQQKCYGRLAALLLRTTDLTVWAFRLAAFRIVKRSRSAQYDQAVEMWALLSRRLSS